jgi:glycine/D-amino acid oxidase-like deaminating enzyme
MYRDLAEELECASYRTLPVLGVGAGRGGVEAAQKQAGLRHLLPSWLDGATGRISPMGTGDDTAQITPSEFVEKMLRAVANRVTVVRGTCVGVVTTAGDNGKQVAAVKYKQDDGDDDDQVQTLPADAVCVSAGPWSCQAEQWFDGAVQLPMEGIKSTSIVWKEPEAGQKPDATALFCGENAKYGTHLEVYPRPDGTIYICGVGGSDYISTTDLQSGAFLRDCPPVEARVEAAVNAFQEMSATYAAAGELERTQACMRPCPPDAMPYMGPVPGVAGAYINAGHNCWGIAWAPACGKAMAELILQGKSTSIDLSPFDPARFTQKRTGRGRKKKGASVGEQW